MIRMVTCLQSWCPVPYSKDNPAALSGSEHPGYDDGDYHDDDLDEDYVDGGVRYDDNDNEK